MSELINNSKIRQENLKKLIKKIHAGMPLDIAKKMFKEEFGTISTEEIVELEQALINDGMPVEEVMSLCDVHAALFNGSISDIHKKKEITDIPGHPAKVFKDENQKILKLIEEEIKPYLGKEDNTSQLMLRIGFERLAEIDKHYSRKENLFFPAMEKKQIYSIPRVMWGVDNEIRGMIKNILVSLAKKDCDLSELSNDINITIQKVLDMVTKEDNILLPKLADTISFSDWITADKGSDEIGYFLEAPTDSWAVKEEKSNEVAIEKNINVLDGEIELDAGSLNPIELNSILNTLPLDMTFVDKNGKVKYFSQGKERIFARPITIIGRDVSMCHPPKSVHIVEKIIESFVSGQKDFEDFYINIMDMFVYIRYFAIRDKEGNYLGTLEITQNIKPIRELSGEKRLASK